MAHFWASKSIESLAERHWLSRPGGIKEPAIRLVVGLSYCEWRDSGFRAQRRDALVPFCGLLIGVSERENIDFREMWPTDLQSNGEAILRKATWY